MTESRTKKVSINMVIALFCQIVNLVVNFASRTAFIKILGAEYLGVNGLFTNVIMLLSFAELGIGNAIIFSMYKPLATKNKSKIKSLMNLYKRAYMIIGVIVGIVGIVFIPFLEYIIKEKPQISENIVILYILFLFNTVVSYFFVYKRSIIIADQKNYVVLIVTEIMHFIQVSIQIFFLILSQNYIIFLLIQIICTILGNVITSAVADNLYPYLKEKSNPLSKDESNRIFRNVKALAVYKFGSVVLNGTDNILISMLIGVSEVGLVSNYILINTSCNAILSKLTEAFTASIGNLNAVGNRKQKYEVFNKIFFITAWLYGFASVGLLISTSSFIENWIGSEYLLDNKTAIAIVIGFYVQGVHYAAYTYRTTLGLFVEGKYSPLFAAIINVLLSILLCKWIGLAGIFIATPIARMLTTGIIDPFLIYKNTFCINPMVYYIKYGFYLFVFSILGVACKTICEFVTLGGWLGLIIQIILISIVFNCSMILLFHNTKLFKGIIKNISFLQIRKQENI